MTVSSHRSGRGKVDPCAISGALAMRRCGFTDAEIERILGHLPPMEMTPDEIRTAMAEQREAERRSGRKPPDDSEPFLGDL